MFKTVDINNVRLVPSWLGNIDWTQGLPIKNAKNSNKMQNENLLYRDCLKCNDRTLHNSDVCLYCQHYNKSINDALFVITQRADSLDPNSPKVAGLETAIAMLKGLLK